MDDYELKGCAVVISYVMQPEDANPAGNVHGGVIVKHVDTASGVVAARFARKNVVTASIDRLIFFHPVFIGNLLTVKAAINWVGRTSLEIGARAETEDLMTGKISHVASAYLTFVALDENGRPASVPAYEPKTPDEIRRFREAEERRKQRLLEKEMKKTGIYTQK